MAIIVITDLKADCGELYDALNDGTTAAKSLLAKASDKIINITGTTVGFNGPIRNLADVYICQQLLGSLDPVTKSVAGAINVGEKRVVEMRDSFVNEVKEDLRIKGYSIRGNIAIVNQVNN